MTNTIDLYAKTMGKLVRVTGLAPSDDLANARMQRDLNASVIGTVDSIVVLADKNDLGTTAPAASSNVVDALKAAIAGHVRDGDYVAIPAEAFDSLVVAYSKGRPAIATAPEPQKVWVLTLTHRHGDDITVYATQDLALAATEAYCREWWNDWFDGDVPDGLSGRDLIDMYFSKSEESSRAEYWGLEELTVVQPKA